MLSFVHYVVNRANSGPTASTSIKSDQFHGPSARAWLTGFHLVVFSIRWLVSGLARCQKKKKLARFAVESGERSVADLR